MIISMSRKNTNFPGSWYAGGEEKSIRDITKGFRGRLERACQEEGQGLRFLHSIVGYSIFASYGGNILEYLGPRSIWFYSRVGKAIENCLFSLMHLNLCTSMVEFFHLFSFFHSLSWGVVSILK